MNLRGGAAWSVLVSVLSIVAAAQPSHDSIRVPEEVEILVRPVLDELQQYRSTGSRDHLNLEVKRFYALSRKNGRFVDEALVVLLCFDVMGESQEDADAVIGRGGRMLPYLKKYRKRDPEIPGRAYPLSLLKTPTHKGDDFSGAIKAIQHGWRGTWQNPEG